MPFNLLLLPLIGGFVLLSHWNLTVFFAKRLDKERLLFYSSLVGAVLLCISFGVSILAVSYPAWPGCHYLLKLRYWWAWNTPPFEYSGITTFALLLGVLGAPILNRWPFSLLWDKDEMGARAVRGYGGPLENLLLKAMNEEKYVMVTLNSGKVYIGRVTVALAPEDDRSFELLPIKSGYREGDKQRLELTTHYDEVFRQIFDGGESDPFEAVADFGVIIPVKEVVSATLFRPDLYAKYFPHRPKLNNIPIEAD